MLAFGTNSAGPERVFLLTKRIQNKLRSRMLDDTLESILQIILNPVLPEDMDYVEIARTFTNTPKAKVRTLQKKFRSMQKRYRKYRAN